MNAPQSSIEFQQPDPFAAMDGQVAQWRGDCIQQFAELEEIVETLLLALGNCSAAGKVKTGQVVGAAFAHLRELTGSKGKLAKKGQAISETLSTLAPCVEWRAHITHGNLTLWRGRRKHQWLVAMSHREPGKAPIRTFALTWKEACDMRDLLGKQVIALRGNARSLANSVLNAN